MHARTKGEHVDFSDIEVNQDVLERTNPVFNTAKMTLFQLIGSGNQDAAALVGKLGLTFEDTQNSATSAALPEQLVVSTVCMESRYRTMAKLAEEARCSVNVDLPCGYTPRAIEFSRKGLRFIGLDIPAAIAEAEPAIMSLIEPDRRDLVSFAGVDATNYESLEEALQDVSGTVCITTEGLFMYFTDVEIGALCENVRRILTKHGGVWFAADPEVAMIYAQILMAVCGDRFMEVMANAKRLANEKSDGSLGNNSLVVRPQDAEGSMRAAMAFLARHGLNAERMVVYDHMPTLSSLDQLTPQQRAAVEEALKRCAFWKITLADGAQELDTTQYAAKGFGVSARLSDGVLRLVLTGRLDTITSPNLLAFYEKHAEEIQAVDLDCSQLSYLSSAGLRVLVMMQKGCSGGVTMQCVNEEVREILCQTGLDTIFTILE